MKPFLLLGVRPEDAAADNEYERLLALSRLGERDLRRVRLEQRPLGPVDLRDWSGVVLGGGPFNFTDPPERKSPVQRRVEADLHGLLDLITAADFPFLGLCYGIGTLGTHQGAVVDRRYGEPVSFVQVSLSAEGRRDPLLRDGPAVFGAFAGHKEAISALPPQAVLLASSPNCPVQAFRIGRNIYATQYHPELDEAGVLTRTEVYLDAGYFPPEQADQVRELARTSDVSHAPAIMQQFFEVHAAPARPEPAGTGQLR